MKRPADQAKLLFLYLLRSSAALATESKLGAAAITKPPIVLEGHIQLRLARRADVPYIQRCNLATLPENYNSQFYVNHLRQWPELALVAEHVPEQRRASAFHSTFDPNKPPPNIVAYVLGKVEARKPFEDSNPPIGHVTSLAVLQDYRRRGLAASLMDQLHLHLSKSYGVGAVGLHVRVSNKAATKLYERDGYFVESVIPQYYQDGEDAFFMKKALEESIQTKQGRWMSRRPRPWETMGPLRLPRRLVQPEDDEETIMEEEEEAQILTGTF